MKINGTNRVNPVNPYKSYQDQLQADGTGKKSKKKDELVISNEAKELLGTQTQGVEQSREKLEALKQAVDSGTYQVDARKLAEKLLPFLK